MNEDLRLTRAQARELDRLAEVELGIPGIVLMENAGRGVAERVLALLAERGLARRVAIACGPGNNGGDGFVVARHLAIAGCEVEIVATSASSAARGDAAIARAIAERARMPIALLLGEGDVASARAALERGEVLVDALLGTGFAGEPRPPVALAIDLLNELAGSRPQNELAGSRPLKELGRSRPIVAIDVPSGLDADTGVAAGRTVRADETVTFEARKRGFDAPGAAAWLGRVVTASIGVPRALVERASACAPDRTGLR